MANITTIKVQKNQLIAKQKDKVKKWYIVIDGAVIQRNSYARVLLGKNSVIGISESDRYLCDYIAGKDSVLAEFPYDSPDDIKNMIQGQESMRGTLLRAAISQRQQLLKTYAGYQNLVRQFHSFVENEYSDYENFKPIEMVHKAENWEVNNSASLVEGYLEPYMQLMQKDDSLCIGAIMEACYQSRRVIQGIVEMVDYLNYHQDILLAESGNDIFDLYYKLLLQAKEKNYDIKPLKDSMDRMAEVIRKLNIYNEKLVAARIEEYQKQDLTPADGAYATPEENAEEDWEETEGSGGEDCLLHILTYAQSSEEEINEARELITKYLELPDILSTEPEVSALRKRLTKVFYDTYMKVFLRAMKKEDSLTPILEMFLNFGFMDVTLAGEENANVLYDLTEHLEVCKSEHVYTIYEWLKSVYEGRNEPSKNEFDLDFPGYLADMRKNGNITAEQQKKFADSRELKIKFEIQNMFPSANRATYGKISTFCPILGEYDLINSIDKMLVTAERLDEAINKIRGIDYSIFYREVMFSDPDKGINHEPIMKEVMPDIILMPNAGTRAMMWQETAGIKRDTSARFMFPVFTAVDIDDMMIETLGRYRWEICRKIQGVHWNDIREKSLTAEYCDYLQFYRKNHELSTEAKEKVKSALLRGRNNYREVFVKDYQNWIKFEAKGSYRLNKIARDILIVYCPFSKSIREDLKSNPMYQNAMHKLAVENAKKIQRIRGVYDKYQKSGGTITPELAENLD